MSARFPTWVLPATCRAAALAIALLWAGPAVAAKIACVGDSITYGYGLSNPGQQSYPAVLQGLVGAQHTVQNFGSSGCTMLKKGDKPYWNDPAYNASDAFKPDVVVIMLGTNDAKPQNWTYQADFSGDYAAMISHYRAAGATVYVAAPPPVYATGAYSIDPSVLNTQVVPLVRQIATTAGAPLIDVYQALSGKASDFPDNVHPNTDGAQLIAQTVAAALQAGGFAGAGGATGAGGVGSGGVAGTGGATGAGGAAGTAGKGGGGGTVVGAGGTAAGGSPATSGGASGAGGARATGGGPGSGGSTSGSGGAVARGGALGVGGGSGGASGAPGAGGLASSGGSAGSGGQSPGSGGTAGSSGGAGGAGGGVVGVGGAVVGAGGAGVVATGGTVSTGGTAAGTGGVTASPSGKSAGCGCRFLDRSRAPYLTALLGLLLLARRSRRRRA
jgi:acyl-CoA thioesterase-1